MGVGAAEFFIMVSIFLGGGTGVPISVPPAEPDPLLNKLSPAEAPLFYSNWSGVAEPQSDADNPTERLLAEPEIQEFLVKGEMMGRMLLARMGEEDPGAQMASRIAPVVLKTLLTQPTMVYVSNIDVGGEAPKFNAGLVVNLGPRAGEVARLLQMIPEEATQPVEIGATKLRRLQLQPEAPAITFGIRGKYLLAAVGENEAEALLARAEGEIPAWLTEVRKRFPVERVSTVTVINVGAALQKFAPLGGPPMQQFLAQTGFKSAQQHVAVTGLDDSGYASFSALDFDGPLQGLLAAAPSEPLKAADLKAIPADPLFAIAFRTDLNKTIDAVLEMVGGMDPRAIQEFEDGIDQVERELGIRVREDILGALGDVWTLHTAAEDGGLVSGWTATVTVKNQVKLTQFSQRMMTMAQQAGGRRAPKIQWSQFQGENIYTLSVPEPEFPFAPSWCVTKERLVVGMFPQAIKSYLIRQAGEPKSLATQPRVAAALETGCISVAAVDNKRMVELAYPFAQMGLRVATGAAQSEGLPLDFSILPSLTSISRHLGVGVTVTRRTAKGFESEQHQALPGGSASATAPVAIALLLPAVQSARGAARRMESSNNLKQIALAVHNYHDTFKTFPPLYNTDKNGKPLLSWRVHLLPFMEEQRLYEEFHLDEPWDSEHNKKLIARMPPTLRSPHAASAPGTTTYLAPASKEAMFQPPQGNENGKPRPNTTGFRDVLDGTSNTAMVVETSDKHAVVWTKPEDYKYNPQAPGAGLRLMPSRGGGYLMAMGDGSVQALRLGAEQLRAVFTRAGGEVVEFR